MGGQAGGGWQAISSRLLGWYGRPASASMQVRMLWARAAAAAPDLLNPCCPHDPANAQPPPHCHFHSRTHPPSTLRAGRMAGFQACRARAMPCRTACACPVCPPPRTRTMTSHWPTVPVAAQAGSEWGGAGRVTIRDCRALGAQQPVCQQGLYTCFNAMKCELAA
jgi:hypothetical protein